MTTSTPCSARSSSREARVDRAAGRLSGRRDPRWGDDIGFFQRRQPAFWLFVITLVITGLDVLSQQAQMISAVPGAWFTTVLLLLPYAIPVIRSSTCSTCTSASR